MNDFGKKLIITFVVLCSVAACSPRKFVRGYNANPKLIAAIRANVDNQESVQAMLGSPTTKATFDDLSWYYYSKRSEQIAFFAEDVTEMDIVAVRFGDNGYVTKVDRYTLADNKVIDTVSKKTITHGKENGFFKELFGNIGRFGSGGAAPQAGN